MAQSQAQNSTDITNVLATLGARQAGKTREKIAGPKRAAMLMLALGEQYGGKIWQMLDDDEVRELSLVMSTLGTVEVDVVENMLLEFVSRMSASGALMGNFDATERLLQQYLPAERVVGIMDEIRGPQHVGKAVQRPGRGARQLPQERISADRRGRALETQTGAFGARARDPA